jgi:hypothetical protein
MGVFALAPHHRGTTMEQYAGIDVSLDSASACTVDAQGKIVKEAKVASEPEVLSAWFAALPHMGRRLRVPRLADWSSSDPIRQRPCADCGQKSKTPAAGSRSRGIDTTRPVTEATFTARSTGTSASVMSTGKQLRDRDSNRRSMHSKHVME